MAYSRFRNLIEMLARKIPDYQENRPYYNEIFQQLIDAYESQEKRHYTTEVGKYINAAFFVSGLTWKIVSQKTGININTLHKFCIGARTPNEAEIDALARVLNFDVQHLKNLAIIEKIEKGDISTYSFGVYHTPKWKNSKNWKDKL